MLNHKNQQKNLCRTGGAANSKFRPPFQNQLMDHLYFGTCRTDAPDEPDKPVSNRWSSPKGCTGSDCEYEAEWSMNKASGVVSFVISANQSSDHWTGIAFAPEPRMVNI